MRSTSAFRRKLVGAAALTGIMCGLAPVDLAAAETRVLYKAINVGGPAITIDGTPWQSGAAAGITHDGNAFQNQAVRLVPGTDAARATMLRSSVWSAANLNLRVPSVPNGTYDVGLFTWEDDAPTTFDVSIEGARVATGVSSGAAGTWRRLNARTTVTDGALDIGTSRGHANISGIELHRVTADAPAPAPAALSLAITTPAASATVEGTLMLGGTHAGARNVEVFRNGAMVARAAITSSSWGATVNTAALPIGTSTFVVRAWDALPGQPAKTTVERSVTVSVRRAVTPPPATTTTTAPAPPPTTAPAPAFSLGVDAPTSGAVVQGVITMSGPQSGAGNVEISRNGTMLSRAVLSQGRWTATLDTARLPAGPTTLEVRAWDSAPGRSFTKTTARSVAVTVQSSVTTPPATAPAPTTPPPTTPPPAETPGAAPTTSTRGSFVERAAVRTYALSGMQVGTNGDAVANGNRMRAVLSAAQPGDVITVAPGHYRLAGNVEFRVRDVTLKGLGAKREDVWFEHTTETRATFMVAAGGVHFYNFTHRVHGSARSSLGQSGEGNIWVQGGHSGFRMQDVLAWGSRDAAIFLYGVHNFELNRVESRDSKSDAYHVSNGSSYGKWFDSVSRNSGDDGIGFVGYGGEGPGTAHHHTVVRHHVAGQTWGRGIGIIHVNNINIHGPTLIEDTAGAGIILAREPQYGSGAIRAIRVYGELRFRRANSHRALEHGAIMIHNPDNVAPIEDVLFTGPIVMADTGVNRGGVSFQVRAHGSGRIQAELRDARFYGAGPATKISTSLSSGSWVTTPGWSNSTSYLGAEPAFPAS